MPTSLVSTGVQFPDSTIQTTAAGAVTTAAVGTATAGLAAGAVGSYAFLSTAINFVAVTAGTNYAGSGLYYSALAVQANDSAGWATTGGAVNQQIANGGFRGSAVSGTWKALGTYTGAGIYYSKGLLFLRVA
jgi:hypothetical protein